MGVPDLATRADVERLLRAFYGRALVDPLLRPVFVDVARLDLEAHLPVIADFWERTLLGTGRYTGRAMAVHRELHARVPLTPEHFDRWLVLWRQALDGLFAGPTARRAEAHAVRVSAAVLRQLGSAPVRPLPVIARPAPGPAPVPPVGATTDGPNGPCPERLPPTKTAGGRAAARDEREAAW